MGRPLVEVGRVGKPHGLTGEVTVVAVSNRPERFAAGSCLRAGERELIVAASRSHRGGWLVRFEGVDDRDAAEALRGAVLRAEPMRDASEGTLWVHEVVGAAVVDREGRKLGRVVAVEANPAHDLLVLDGGDLVPVVFVVEHEPGEPGRVVVDVPDGLLDLNRRGGEA